MSENPFVGKWSYRSFYNDPTQFLGDSSAAAADIERQAGELREALVDAHMTQWLEPLDLIVAATTPPGASCAKLEALILGYGTIEIVAAPKEILKGTIGGSGWQLDLYGSRSYGNPMEVRFRGTGVVGGHEWIYAYVGYLVPQWPEGVQQRAALVGSIVRVIDHPSSSGGISPAGVVGSWYAVRQDGAG